MREAYTVYIKEHPEELKEVVGAIQRSRAIQREIDQKITDRLALIQRCREELEDEARNKRS